MFRAFFERIYRICGSTFVPLAFIHIDGFIVLNTGAIIAWEIGRANKYHVKLENLDLLFSAFKHALQSSQFFELKLYCNQNAVLFLLKCSTTSTPVPANWYSSTTYAGTAVSLNWYWGETRVSPRKQ